MSRRNRNKRKKPPSATPIEPKTVRAEVIDTPGGVLQDRRHLRNDTQIVARMYAAGVVSVEDSERILRAAYVLAASAAKEQRHREFCSLMRVIESAAKMHRDLTQPLRTVHQHLHAHGEVNHRSSRLSQITAGLGFPDLAERYSETG